MGVPRETQPERRKVYRDTRSCFTVRVTPAQRDKVLALAARLNKDVTELLREGLELVSVKHGELILIPSRRKSAAGVPCGWKLSAETRQRISEAKRQANAERRAKAVAA